MSEIEKTATQLACEEVAQRASIDVSKVKELTVKTSTKEHKCYMRKPNRKEFAAYWDMRKNKPFASAEMIFNTCWLEGAPEIKDDDDLYINVVLQCESLIDYYETELKNA